MLILPPPQEWLCTLHCKKKKKIRQYCVLGLYMLVCLWWWFVTVLSCPQCCMVLNPSLITLLPMPWAGVFSVPRAWPISMAWNQRLSFTGTSSHPSMLLTSHSLVPCLTVPTQWPVFSFPFVGLFPVVQRGLSLSEICNSYMSHLRLPVSSLSSAPPPGPSHGPFGRKGRSLWGILFPKNLSVLHSRTLLPDVFQASLPRPS